MKINKIFLGVAAMALMGLTACEDDPKYTPTQPIENPSEYYFSNGEAESTVVIGDDDTQITVNLYRAKTAGEATVNVNVTSNAPGLFNGPASVTFADGEAVAPVAVTFDTTTLTMGEDYTITVSLDIDATEYYSNQAVVHIDYLTWTTLGNAAYTETLVSGPFTAPTVTYEVEIQEHPMKPGLFRLVNPYGAAYPYNEPGDWDDTKDYYMYINATNPAKVFNCDENGEPAQFLSGMDWGYGPMVMESMASAYLALAAENPDKADAYTAKAEENYGKFLNGNITFPVEKSWRTMMPEYNADSFWYANKLGEFRIVLPGYEPDLPVDTWESLGNATYTDGFIVPMYGLTATYEVEVQENQDAPGLYRLVNPYTDAFPYGGPADKDYYIVIDATDPDCVVVEMQETGFVSDEDGAWYICNFAGNALAGGATVDQIIENGRNDVLADGVITFKTENEYCYWPETDPDHIYKAQNPQEGVLVLPGAQNAAAYAASVNRAPLQTLVDIHTSKASLRYHGLKGEQTETLVKK